MSTVFLRFGVRSLLSPISFKKQFARYLEDDIGSEDIEEIYKNAHEAIRKDPTFKPSDKSKDWKTECAKHKDTRLTYEQRQKRIQEKIAAFKAGGADEDDE